jgi:biopolymer transport protein ExbD
MRSLSFLLLLTAMACTSPQTNSQSVPIDTAKLSNPYPLASNDIEVGTVFDNCLMVDGDSIDVVINQQRQNLKTKKEVEVFLEQNAHSIKQRRFYIIYDNNTPFQEVVELIDMLKSAKINNYQALNLRSLIKLNQLSP